jgi:hypothetical protein
MLIFLIALLVLSVLVQEEVNKRERTAKCRVVAIELGREENGKDHITENGSRRVLRTRLLNDSRS